MFYWKGIKIEFIVLESISLEYCTQIKNTNLYYLNLNFHVFQVFLSLGYIIAPVFQHDREKKVNNILKDLKLILIKENNLDLDINTKINQKFLMSQIYTSTIISYHYNYEYLPIFNYLKNSIFINQNI
ncbi:hypothetical protein [Mesomycoplasma neurolyticum]|uniref:Uncharacterized protein n=1 Tax=Mesomycoplasma neurolyticum TaxID=2120 RepID=A0A449A4T0_9BACT|nr:hypothetical protein [Mesomycoplasma neurolyticum]VEU59236.1 Uncharacterised protein [Mesomycoplasma neurolyticum]